MWTQIGLLLEVVGRKFSHRPGNPATVGVVRWPAAGDTAGSSLRRLNSLQHRIYNLLGSNGAGQDGSSSSSSSFYLPNNTAVCTFARTQYSRRAGQQGPIWTLTAALKRSIKTVTGCIFYHTNKNITNEKKSKQLILSEYVNKSDKIGRTWTNTNSYWENEALPDTFTWNILRHNCFMFEYSVTESSRRNYC